MKISFVARRWGGIARLLFLTTLILTSFCYQPVLALTDYLYFVVNGDSSLTEMTQGDNLAWGANCDTGSTTYWEIWYDVNSNSVPEAGVDILLHNHYGTDGNVNPPDDDDDGNDISNIPDGYYQLVPLPLGLPPGPYIFKVLDLADSTSVTRILINNEMSSPPNQFTGHVTVPGHPAPDVILENIWIDADQDEGDAGYYAGITDINGYYEINIGSAGTGQIFTLETSDLPGYISPWEQYAIASGLVNNLDFAFVAPADSVYGFIKDELGTTINREIRIEALPWSTGTDTKVTHTNTGRYTIYFAASELGQYELGTWDTELLPTNLLPKRLWFTHDTIGSFQHDIICYQADSHINIIVTENGVTPGLNYLIFGSSDLIASETQGVSGTGNDNLLTLPISTDDPSGWQVYLANWSDQYPIPSGFYLETSNPYNLGSDDTVYFNFIGPMVRGMVVQDAEDEPISSDLIWVGLNSDDGDYTTTPDTDGTYTFYPDNGAYLAGAYSEGCLINPSWGIVNVSNGLATGPTFTINRTHSRVTGILTNITLPLDSSNYYVTARTGSGADGYMSNTTVDSLTGAYSLWLCDGDWVLEPPYIDGYTTPDSATFTIDEIPDTLRVIDFVYGSGDCCGQYTGGFTGNTNCSADGKRNLADITQLIDRVFLSKIPLCCEENGNVNGDIENKINLADITKIIDHVFLSKAETAPCE